MSQPSTATETGGTILKDRSFSLTRIVNAPRELVYRMWTEAEHIAQWWGPNGFTTTIHLMDVRVGGEWSFTMHAPDGHNFRNHKVYLEVVPPERLVMEHDVWPRHRMTAVFSDLGDQKDKTSIAIDMSFESQEDFDKVIRDFGAAKGLSENIDRLEAYLASR
jgi:uncharacterized protein YndB with AHSA1/START domain